MRTPLWPSLVLSVVCGAALAATPAAGNGQQPKAAVHAPKAPVPLADDFKVLLTRGASFSHDETMVAFISNEGGRLDRQLAYEATDRFLDKYIFGDTEVKVLAK